MRNFSYRVKAVGKPETEDYLVYLTDENGKLLSFFHDVPLYVDSAKSIVNMVYEIPGGTSAKYEISTGTKWNPIKQDTKNGKLRYVAKKYLCNYGALPKTWEDPEMPMKEHEGVRGDCDPIDVLDISTVYPTGRGVNKVFIGQIKPVKVLGVLGLIDEGEIDWKVIAIDVKHPKAESLHDISDVDKEILDDIREWFRSYKAPHYNEFALNGQFMGREYAMEVIRKCEGRWKGLLESLETDGSVNTFKISCTNSTNPNQSLREESSFEKVCRGDNVETITSEEIFQM